MLNQRELFEFTHAGRRLRMAVRGHKGRRTYLGYINGGLAATGLAKGELLRNLIQLARHYPKAPAPGQAVPMTAV